MSKVLIIGAAPLPFENEKKIYGPGIRTWQFVKPLLEDRHKVCLVALKDSNAYFKKKKELIITKKNFLYYAFDRHKFMNISVLQSLYNKLNPDCVVSISSSVPSGVALKIKITCPLWFDRGDIMAEAQLKAFNEHDDDMPRSLYMIERSVLAKGDKFSVVSFPQKCSVIGRLGAASRLSRYTLGYEFVHVIPCGIDHISSKKKVAFLRRKSVAKDDFVVLWSGGYNTWTDVDTLFGGITYAMKRNDRIKFVSTGGSLGNQDNLTYGRFTSLIQKSSYKDRFCMLGWIAAENLPSVYSESDLGINVDRDCYEVLLGSRHRLMDWMISGLPFITTTPSELTQFLCNSRLAFTFSQGDAKSLGLKILELSKKRRLLKAYAIRIKKFSRDNYSLRKTTLPLREWVKEPKFAPDKIIKKAGSKSALNIAIKSFDENERLFFNSQINDFKLNVKNLEGQRDSLHNHIKSLENQSGDFQQHIKDLEGQCAAYQLHIKSFENQSGDFQQHIKDLEGQRNSLQQHVNNLEGQRDSLHNHIKSLENQSGDFQQHIKDLEGQCAAYQLHIKSFENQSGNFQQHIKDLEGQRNSLQQHVNNLEVQSDSLHNHIKSFENQSGDFQQHIKDLEGQRNSLQQHVNNLEVQSDSLHNHIKSFENQSGDFQQHIKDLEGRCEALTKQGESQLQELLSLHAKNQHLAEQFSVATADIVGLEQEKSVLKFNVARLDKDIKNLKSLCLGYEVELKKIKGSFSYKAYMKIKKIFKHK